MLAAQAIGEASKAIELTLQWVVQRKAFGATLWDKQAIRQRLAMQSARIEAARALLYNTAWRHAQGQEVVVEASMLKALCGTLVNEVMYDCVQFHGGAGYLRESADRADGARRAHPGDRRRRHRGDARRDREADAVSRGRSRPSGRAARPAPAVSSASSAARAPRSPSAATAMPASRSRRPPVATPKESR